MKNNKEKKYKSRKKEIVLRHEDMNEFGTKYLTPYQAFGYLLKHYYGISYDFFLETCNKRLGPDYYFLPRDTVFYKAEDLDHWAVHGPSIYKPSVNSLIDLFEGDCDD